MKFSKITEVKILSNTSSKIVYDIELKKNHIFKANGI